MNRGRSGLAPLGVMAILALLAASGCQPQESSKPLVNEHAKSGSSRAEVSKKKGEDFLAENAKKPGVKTTESGLQYVILKEGTGKQPKASDTVVVLYQGATIDGKVFSPLDQKKPLTTAVNKVIPGWQEALVMMKEGSKWRVFVPSNLAYGKAGLLYKLGPNETLIYEMELVKVK